MIKIEDLSPKNIINFYLPHSVTPESVSLVFVNTDGCNNDFLQEVFDFSEVKRLLIAENLLSLQYAENADKEELKALILGCIDDYMQSARNFNNLADVTDLQTKCEAVADALIRPTLNRDNGDITITLPEQNVLEVQFTGHCAGCPYAQNTLQNVIVRTFKRYLPQIRNVKLKE